MVNIPLLLMGCGGWPASSSTTSSPAGTSIPNRFLAFFPPPCIQSAFYFTSLFLGLQMFQGVMLRVVGVCDSKSMVAVPDVLTSHLDDEFLLKLCKVKSSGSSLQELGNFGGCQVFSGQEIARKVMEFAATLRKLSGLALVDCSASTQTVELLGQAVNLDCCVVLANKKPLTSSLNDYDKLVSQPRRIRHESTVGAGLPVISSINRILSSGDPIFRIIGSLSGTLGYVMSEVEGGRPFSEVVNTAKRLGYTEPDPRDDLGGMDVARKGNNNFDHLHASIGNYAKSGSILVPIKTYNGYQFSRCEVGIQEVAKDSALGRLKGSDNVLEIYSRCYSEQPLVIQGAGAGNDTTAAGVLADILDIQDLFRH
ncbi:Homoserine dehydrogenase [Sesamum angolense]|uniref:Homoserine dehydrogenase n=1 Tax=Sesamum angolense TaxID=2727404 RepID=A0AAE2C470_9LAMI|nr:Homoserine dehydrogenase [Sesamum angolense]